MDPNSDSEAEKNVEDNKEEEIEAKSAVHTRIQKVLSATGGPGYALGRLLMDGANQTPLKSPGGRPTPAPRDLTKKQSTDAGLPPKQNDQLPKLESPSSNWTCSRCGFDDNETQDSHCRLCNRGVQ